MSDNSEIQWTDATWNPVTGCSKVSPGCAHCYAETLTMRYAKSWKVPGLPWTPANAAENVILKPHKLDEPLKWKKPRMIFVNSMSDLFHELVPDDYIAEVFAVMSRAPRHVFQVLTKRPDRARELLTDETFPFQEHVKYHRAGIEPELGGFPDLPQLAWPLPNVWIGTSIENRQFVDRADALRGTPAAVRFISAEPLLGPLVHNARYPDGHTGWRDKYTTAANAAVPQLDLDGIDWLIVGGESGPKHRPMEERWVLDLREACLRENLRRDPNGCAKAGPHFFFKQWGGRTPKSGGRLLEGREWNEMPAALPAEEGNLAGAAG